MIRCSWPTTAQEAYHAARSQERRERWADAEADALRARWQKQSEEYWARRDAARFTTPVATPIGTQFVDAGL